MKEKLLEVALRYIDNTKEANDLVSELLVLFNVGSSADYEREAKSRREQIADINQWSSLLISNRKTIRERIMWSMIADIQNRTEGFPEKSSIEK